MSMPIFATQTRATPLLCAAAMLISHLLFSGHLSGVQGPQVTGTDRHINDVRTEPLKDLNGYFPMVVPKSKAQWLLRADRVRQQVKVALGLWPPPAKTPLNPVIYGKIDCGDYTVEKTFFESMPGFYVTGSLYRPKTASGKLPGILCPHGHWANGRFYDAGEANAKSQIAQGAESDLETARNPIQARCVHLARMGCVVFQYDMIGYADSVQISSEIAHRFAKQRPAYNTPEKWGLFSPQAELHLQSVMGLQSWNSIRCLDFLESLPDVDDNRLAVTGASGGGTQTFLLAAIDARIQVSFPAVMVSTAMQGGCTCENCTLLRVTTGNIELAALFAPKPQGVTAANDWTKEMRTKGFPELKGLYQLMGSPENIMMVDRTELQQGFPHGDVPLVSKAFKFDGFGKRATLSAINPTGTDGLGIRTSQTER
jgi:dienelactone hydrolase